MKIGCERLSHFDIRSNCSSIGKYGCSGCIYFDRLQYEESVLKIYPTIWGAITVCPDLNLQSTSSVAYIPL